MNTFGPVNSLSTFLPIEFDLPLESTEEKWREIIAKRERLTSQIVNVKANGNYELEEILSGQQWFSTQKAPNPRKLRYGYRRVFDLVALNSGVFLGPGATYTFRHNISGVLRFTNWYGIGLTTGTNGLSVNLPNPSATAGNIIEISVDFSSIKITMGSTYTLQAATLVIEYLKQD
jgi:hypothetical protein